MRVAPVLMHSQHLEQHLYWTNDIWRFLEAMGYPGVWTPWDLLNVDCAGLDLIASVKSLFPHFNMNWKSLVQEKQHKLDHVAVVMDVNTAVTAVKNNITSSTAASKSLTPPASQAQKHERRPLSPGQPGPYSVRGVPTPFSN